MRSIPLLPADSPFRPDPVMSPTLRYAEGELVLAYVAADETSWVRVTFEGLDAVRACRGEISPYWSEENDDFSPISVVRPSAWLRERHAYEAEHYGDAYEWGRGADTMLLDTHHHLFLFHDEFVEVLARGVWFELSAGPPTFETGEEHPLAVLAPDTRVLTGEHEGIAFEVRRSGAPVAALIADARLCSQPLFQFFLDGRSTPDRQVRVRSALEGDEIRAELAGFLGVEERRFDRLPEIDELMPEFLSWIAEVAGRRRD